jgi:hypothetical protein
MAVTLTVSRGSDKNLAVAADRALDNELLKTWVPFAGIATHSHITNTDRPLHKSNTGEFVINAPGK